MSKKLLKSTAIVSAMTFLSRICGLLRDIIMAQVLGATALADAFNMAFRIPNFFRRIFGEGAFSQAFIPVFAELTTQNAKQSRQFISATAGLLGLTTLVLSVLGVLYAPIVVRIFAPGFVEDAEKFVLTVHLLRWMFPYLFYISLVAMSAAVLNTLNRFAVPAVTPVLLNICMIVSLLYCVPFFDNAAQALAVGVLVAGVLQLVYQLPALKKQGYLCIPKIDLHNTYMRRVMLLMLPAILSVSVAQINLLVNSILASLLQTGSVSWLYYSSRLMEFPVGIFGIAVATVVLPSLSKQYTANGEQRFSATLDWALRWVVLIAVPASVGLYVLATPLVATIFQNTWVENNAFTVRDIAMSAIALQAYALGVVAIILIKILAPGFFARQDTSTPMKIAVVSLISNVVLSLILVRAYQHTGLALAISAAAWVNAFCLFACLLWQKVYRPQLGWGTFLLKVLLAVVCMAAVLFWQSQDNSVWYAYSTGQRLIKLLFMIISGGASYFGLLWLLGLRPYQLLLKPND